jgi:membrane protein
MRFYILQVIGLNFMSYGYFSFGFSFDYNQLLNYTKNKHYTKYIIKNTLFLIICLIVALLGILIFNRDIFTFMIPSVFINSLLNIPIIIILNIYTFRRINLFDNKFVILKQEGKNFLAAFIQIIISIIFYYYLLDINIYYKLTLILLVYISFFFSLSRLSQNLKHKVRNEYIKNK